MTTAQLDIAATLTRCGSDKDTTHSYGRIYRELLESRRQDPLPILEIGVYRGSSLRAWHELFSNSLIHGIDIDRSAMIVDEPRIVTHLCSQTDSKTLHAIAAAHGPFQLIIDDGSHRLTDMISAFSTLRNFLTPDGLYFIEDIQEEAWLENFRTPHHQIFDTRNLKGRSDDMLVLYRP